MSALSGHGRPTMLRGTWAVEVAGPDVQPGYVLADGIVTAQPTPVRDGVVVTVPRGGLLVPHGQTLTVYARLDIDGTARFLAAQ